MKNYFVEYKFLNFVALKFVWRKKHDCLKQYLFNEIFDDIFCSYIKYLISPFSAGSIKLVIFQTYREHGTK